ncbi:MAG: endolytic transglycosylase MltG [Treponema sp.]|jgi:UPF0755 protein|nr:endolytic transglycosylase MltG [Treponema sp.]
MPRIARRIIKFFVFLIGFALVLAALAAGTVIFFNAAPGNNGAGGPYFEPGDSISRADDGSVYLEVRRGESAQSVGIRLANAGLIRSRYFWRLLSSYNKDFIKAGTYQLKIPATQMEIYRVLVSGKQMLQRVTIPEGVTLKKMARIFADAGICGEGDFLEAAADTDLLELFNIPGKTLEGYLYPDTYLFPPDYPARSVAVTLANTFFSRLEEIDPKASGLSREELNRIVIIASIVEREYRVGEEAPLMAGVFYNRLRIGMALQSCATVEYIITEIQGRPHPEVLYTRDTEIRDPYNTYVRPGLPPGPISAPGKTALDAALHPAASDYLYFRLVERAAGRHYFSRTLDDHIRAGALYVKGRS